MSDTPKTPASARKPKPAATREDRLAEALRANLRRRKTPRSAPATEQDEQATDNSASESPSDRS
ncbi:MAG: hypothetical protein JJ884_14295 [Maricaulis sp.]|uniref:hypothetical protein n=1 Tax=Maricaulis sp. TaxID=1486257 RepID=UPI001B22275F|nr:hypothetical protein [Maricaulis sp.]MBO6729146.1 hypothetical protein [Maricaulis sp.]MBO6848678.1 hypothetical protein [Maricaulis sp.]MBO6878642.1 hypothetical protein [Maricaulis sp.]